MKTTKTLLGILAVGFALWFGTTVQAQTDDPQSLANIRSEAEKGGAKAQYDLGIILEQKNRYAEALQWFCMAAEQNYSAAQYKIGVYFESGSGVEKDILKAYEWYLLAASQGNSDARGWAKHMEDNSILSPEQITKGKEEFQSFAKSYLADQKEAREKVMAEAKAKIDAQIKVEAAAKAEVQAKIGAQIDAQNKADAAAKLEAQLKASTARRRNVEIAAGVLATIGLLCFAFRKKLHLIYTDHQKAVAEQRLASFKKAVSAYDDQALLEILKAENHEKTAPDLLPIAQQEAESRGGMEAIAKRIEIKRVAMEQAAEKLAVEQLKDQVHRLSDGELLEIINYHHSTSSPDTFLKIDPLLGGLSHKEPSELLAIVDGILKSEADARGGIETLTKAKDSLASNPADIQTPFDGLCPFCKEEIKEGAIKCKHCGEILNKDAYAETKRPGLGDFDFKGLGIGEIIILASTLVAFISLFMPWIAMGIISVSGWTCKGYLYILPFIYPLIGVFNVKVFNKAAGIICGAIALIASIWYIADSHYNDSIMGRGNASAIGLYLFAATTIGLIIGAVKYKRHS